MAHESGSTSSSVGSRPVTMPPKNMPIEIGVPNAMITPRTAPGRPRAPRPPPPRGPARSGAARRRGWPFRTRGRAAPPSRRGACSRSSAGRGRAPPPPRTALKEMAPRSRRRSRSRSGRRASARSRRPCGLATPSCDEEVVAQVRAPRDAAAGRLQPDQAGARGRDADRPAAVAAVGERDHAAGHGSGCAAAASRRACGPCPRDCGPARSGAAPSRAGSRTRACSSCRR